MTKAASWRRMINRYAPFTLSLVGMGLVFGGVIMYLENDLVKIAAVTGGAFVFVMGFWYRFNPFLTSERRYGTLRHELDAFIGLVRRLHGAAISPRDEAKLASMKTEMHASVDRLVELADKAPPPAQQ